MGRPVFCFYPHILPSWIYLQENVTSVRRNNRIESPVDQSKHLHERMNLSFDCWRKVDRGLVNIKWSASPIDLGFYS